MERTQSEPAIACIGLAGVGRMLLHGPQAEVQLRCMEGEGEASHPHRPVLTVEYIAHEGLDLAQAAEAHRLAFQAVMRVVPSGMV